MALASIPSCNTLSFLHNFFLLRACSRCFMGKSNALSESVRSWDLESAPRPCQVPTNRASQRFAQRCPLPCIATAVQSYATCARARAKLRFRVQHRGKKRGRKNPAAALREAGGPRSRLCKGTHAADPDLPSSSTAATLAYAFCTSLASAASTYARSPLRSSSRSGVRSLGNGSWPMRFCSCLA